jgi:predicted nucleic acid-binding protein
VTVVVDATVVVAGLASVGRQGGWAESVLAAEPLAAPHLMPVEAASILHRAELAGEISSDVASLAHADLGRLRVEYFPYAPFAERIWELRARDPAAAPDTSERMRLVFHSAAAEAGAQAADPAEVLSGSDPRQREMLLKIRRGLAEVQTSCTRMELQIKVLLEAAGKHERRADEARAAGRADVAREEVSRKNTIEAELSGLRSQYQSLQGTQDRLQAAAGRLQEKIDQRSRLTAAAMAGLPYLTCYDAWYVALAEFLGAKLATLNAGLALTPGPRCGFRLPPA